MKFFIKLTGCWQFPIHSNGFLHPYFFLCNFLWIFLFLLPIFFCTILSFLSNFAITLINKFKKVLNCENYFRTQINPVRNLFQLFYFKNDPTSSISDITVYKTYSYNTFREENSLKNIKAKETNDIFFFFLPYVIFTKPF